MWPTTRTQKCWVHKVANVLSALPKRAQPEAKQLLADIYTAETPTAALEATQTFADELAAHPKATGKVTDDLDNLLTFFDFPTEHHIHLRSTNAIESTFATVRLRQRTTTGPGSRQAGTAMAYKLLDAASNGGDGSTLPTWSPWSAPARHSSTASSKNETTTPTTRPRKCAPPEHLEEPHPQDDPPWV